jgi:hypothetical protein
MLRKVILAVLSLYLTAGTSSSFAEDANLSYLAKEKGSLKVFVKEVLNESGQAQIKADDFKKEIENSMMKRRSMSFEVVKAADSSDIQVSAIIKNYQYMVRGPLKLNPSVSGMILDGMATATHNYVEMGVEFTVIDTKTGQVLWKDTINTYIKRPMTPEESIPLIFDKEARTFLWKCFGKVRKSPYFDNV